jgi:hypothetical protein
MPTINIVDDDLPNPGNNENPNQRSSNHKLK